MISECDRDRKRAYYQQLALPVVRRLYEALYQQGRYHNIEIGDGTLQRRLDLGLCPKCVTAFDGVC